MDLVQEFKKIVTRDISREGIAELIQWLDSSDFYTAPASTRFHGSFEGGLLLHSLNVFSQLTRLCKWYECDASAETIAIVSLFHDLCKIGCYKTETRWRKNAANQWEQYTCYTFKEDFAYGSHGGKSVYLLQNFLKLTPDEATAINCHMGQWEATQYGNPTEVYCRNKLAWLLHVADEAADFIMENEQEEKK